LKKAYFAALIILLVISMVGLSYAETTYGPMKKAGRGAKNLLLGWTDIPLSITEVTMDTNNAALGLSAGLWQGFKKAFPRTVSGLVDLVTFAIPDYDKSPVSPDPLMEPATATATSDSAMSK